MATRRRPFNKFLVILVLIVSLSFPLYLFYQSSQGKGERTYWFQRGSVRLLSPVFGLVTSVRENFSHLIRHYFFLVDAARQNEKLKSELLEYRLKEIFYEGVARENERLASLYNFQKRLPFKTIPARVIAFSPVGEFQLLTIDRGEEEGIERGAVVLSENGLLGRVIRVYPEKSQILLITDPTSAVDAEVKRTRARGLVVGRGTSLGLSRDLFIGAFELWDGSQEVADGDLLVTTGLDGAFPKDLPIGTAKNVRKGEVDVFLRGEVIPLVDFYKQREVLIIKP